MEEIGPMLLSSIHTETTGIRIRCGFGLLPHCRSLPDSKCSLRFAVAHTSWYCRPDSRCVEGSAQTAEWQRGEELRGTGSLHQGPVRRQRRLPAFRLRRYSSQTDPLQWPFMRAVIFLLTPLHFPSG
jgi:hypothetical protein